MYLSIHPYFDSSKLALKYSQTEIVDSFSKIKHPIFKALLEEYNVNGVEITSTADVPSGTGLGSSSSFTVGLINTLCAYTGKYVSRGFLAKEACKIEISKLGAPIGKQDQYAAAFGGLNMIWFKPNGETIVEPILYKQKIKEELEENLVMFYTGDIRNANSILAEQNINMDEGRKYQNLIEMCKLALEMRHSIEKGSLDLFGDILDKNWKLKKELASGISNSRIDDYYEIAKHNGALGGKLLGAGGGGFLLFYCEKKNQRRLKNALGLREFPFEFDNTGSSVIFVGEKYWN